MNTLSIRSHLLNVLLIGACALAGCGGGAQATPPSASTKAAPTTAPATEAVSAPEQTNDSLTLVEWSGYELPEFYPDFVAKHADVAPNYKFFVDDAEAYTIVESGFDYDLVHPCTNYWKLYVDAGLIQPIDTTRLSNWSGIRPELAELGQFNGQQYFVPWDWGFESILYRTDKVTTPPKSWADLWNPEYAGHISLYDCGECNYMATALSLGFDPWNTTPEQDEQIKQKLIELKPNLLTYWADFTEINSLIASGDVWVAANVWNDAYKSAVDEGIPVEYITPTEGRLGWVCGFAMSANSKNMDLAYDYLDALIAPEAMAYLSNEYAYGAANAKALELTDPEFIELFSLDDTSVLENTIFYRPLTNEQRETFTSAWSEIQAAP